ncbi:MAG: response regulator [Deltaproteobacteria bacterium]|nr:response regulator [Deltaproteobacteria bacterium]
MTEQGPPDLTGKKVLMVDDDKTFHKLYAQLLKPTGCEIVTAFDGVQATGTMRREKPDLIFLDIGLPGGDGYVLLERWANLVDFFIPVIVISSKDPSVARDKALKGGASVFLEKAAVSTDLYAAIREALG